MRWILPENKKRLFFIGICIIAFYVIVIIRLFYVQVIQQEHYAKLAEQNWDREIPFASERGLILDRNGVELVKNELAPTLYYMKSSTTNGEEIAKTHRINPEMHIPEQATAVHGISDDDVKNEPTFKQILNCRIVNIITVFAKSFSETRKEIGIARSSSPKGE